MPVASSGKQAKPRALITGASSGIGMELAWLFAEDGYDLVLVARRQDLLQGLSTELERQYKTKCSLFSLDLATPTAAFELCQALDAAELKIDVLVNNAGFGLFGKFVELPLSEQLRMVQLNVTTLMELTYRLIPQMQDRSGCGVWNIASTAGFVSGPLMAVYYATKAFVLSFSEALGNELQGSVKVCALCPGPTESGFQAAAGLELSGVVRGKFLPTSEEVARSGYHAFQKGRSVFITGWSNRFLILITRFIPRAVMARLIRRVQETKVN